ncbi:MULTISPECIES: type II toxin-antitoxin system Phd/YefM family antitoxin [Kocuria]|uniref:Type II toxin-antitoxin system prevent-host-death family antitoxin n=1 Tax=Kocuria subflava TaxID=1736139 RepID=A0A846U500_9MICC|nr:MULTISPECIES: type II toxin-antitoxin system prevent-host-death family antitoxin [Kocuria]NKE09831.1 type II toxin-antitoxin system prevent-host-death family antitoxin [Kocuria subflava]
MTTVTKRDLNQRTAEVLARVVEAGEVVVTERGEPRWRVSYYVGQDDSLARAQRQGRYTPPVLKQVPWPEVVGGPRYESGDVDLLLDQMKGDH